MTNAEYIKTIPTLTNKELLEELDYCGYDSYYRTIREPVIEEITKRLNRIAELENENAELKAQIEKLIDFVLSKTECCDVCPITDTCINSEGTCPYAGILAKGEEEVTREWLVQKVAKEIKEK